MNSLLRQKEKKSNAEPQKKEDFFGTLYKSPATFGTIPKKYKSAPSFLTIENVMIESVIVSTLIKERTGKC